MVSKNKELNRYETLCEDGSVVPRPLTAEDEKKGMSPAKITLASQEFIMVPDKVNPKLEVKAMRCFTTFSYVPESREDEIKDAEVKVKNRKLRTMHQFLVTHANAEVHNMKGVNTNKNLQSPLVIVIDETNSTRAKKTENELLTRCLGIAESLYKVDEKGFIDLCYSLNLPNIHLSNPETLYNKMCDMIKQSPVFFDETYQNKQRALLAMINRAVYQPLPNGTTAIEFKAGYYQLDNLALTKNKDELVDYFNANPNSLNRLEQLMGVFIPRPELKRLEETAPVAPLDKDNTKPAAEIVKKQTELKQKVYQWVYAMRKKSALDNEDWEAYMGKVKELKEQNPENETYIDQQSNTLCEANKLENPFKKTLMTA
jgi:hypothetical protein